MFQYLIDPSREPEMTRVPHLDPSTAVTQSYFRDKVLVHRILNFLDFQKLLISVIPSLDVRVVVSLPADR